MARDFIIFNKQTKMKKLRWIIVGLFVIQYVSSLGQKNISEGTIIYDVSIGTAAAQNKATSTIFIKGNNSRTEMISALGNEITIRNAKSNSTVILKEFSGQKLMIKLTKEDWEGKNRIYNNTSFEFTDEMKNIAGYNCKKAIAKTQDGKTFVVYYTSDLLISNKGYDVTFANLPGLPMEYEVESGKMKFKYTISKISFDPVPVSKFDFPTAGYRVMTYEENQQMKKGN